MNLYITYIFHYSDSDMNIPNHRKYDCLFNMSFSNQKKSNLHNQPFGRENQRVIRRFPSQRASNAESDVIMDVVSIVMSGVHLKKE